jgi:dihydrofolate synthase/folylpolyglutamate synthase
MRLLDLGVFFLLYLRGMSALRGARALEKEYVSVLSRLFKPVKGGESRHIITSQSTEDLFHARKKKIDELFHQNPFPGSCKVVHVAGTKGKGSTVEYISKGLIGNGKSVGIFTSPHMHTARERIRVGRNMISQEDMVRYGEDALRCLSGYPWTVFFDLLLVAALKYFDDRKVEYMVLESGIGGRFDTTNFIDTPAVCVITSISLDHQQLLGETVEEIAWQKAGIIKPRTHVFTPASQLPSVIRVFKEQCDLVRATLHVVPVCQDSLAGIAASFETDVQVENACLSQAVLEFLKVSPAGWDTFYWPCRMEQFHYAGRTLVLDGCHNGYSMESFLRGMRKSYPDKRLLVLFGAGQDKSVTDMMCGLLDEADAVMMVQSKHFRAIPEAELIAKVPVERRRQVLHELQRCGPSGTASLGERLQLAVDHCNPDE